MAAGIVIVPGNNAVLQRLAQQLTPFSEVTVLPSANAMLWRARQEPPTVVVADVALDDMTGAEIVEILPNLAPSARLILCGPRNAELDRVVQGTTVEIVTPDANSAQALWAIYKLLGIAPPPPRPATNPLNPSRSSDAAANEPEPAGSAAPAKATDKPSVPAPATPMPRTSQTAAPTKQVVSKLAGDGGSRAAPTLRAPSAPSTTTASGPKLTAPNQPASEATKQVAPQPATSVKAQAVPRSASGGRNGAAAEQWQPRGDALVIRPQQNATIQAMLNTLATDVGSQTVLLSDMAGMVLLKVGTVSNILPEMLGPILATNFSASVELSRQLNEQEPNALYLHEGARYDIYAFNVGYRFILTLIFDKEVGPSKLGSVWVYAKRVTRQLQHMLEA